MAVTYGFYNALNHDRLYDAIQMSSIFDGIIQDGIFSTIGTSMIVTAPEDGMFVDVGPGRAWFNHTWTLNDTEYPIEAEAAEVVLDRIDAVVIEVNANPEVRANSIKFVKGTPSSNPVKPTLIHNAEVNQYALAYVTIRAGQTTIFQADIENVVGTDETPFVTGLLQQVSVEQLLLQWNDDFYRYFAAFQAHNNAEFNTWMEAKVADYNQWYAAMEEEGAQDLATFDTWFQHMKDQLDEDAAGHLQAEIDELAEDCQKGSVVTITTDETELINRSCVISQGSDTVTKQFDSNGVAEFPSMPYIGAIHVESTDGDNVAQGDMTIPYFGRYSMEIAFWAATFNISTSADGLIGRPITITKGGVVVGTTSFNQSGRATYKVHEPGTYQVTSTTAGGDEYASTVVVTEETAYAVNLGIPSGETATPTDDIQTWLKCASIYDKSYTLLADVLDDYYTCERLFSDSNACDYMARSSSWAAIVVTDASVMEQIGKYSYCVNALLGDSTWEAAIAASNYMSSVINVENGLVPIMTSDTTPSGEATAQSTHAGPGEDKYLAYKAFNKVSPMTSLNGVSDLGYYCWHAYASPPANNAWIQYHFPTGIKLHAISIQSFGTRYKNYSNLSYRLASYQVQGSNDNTNWTDLTSVITYGNTLIDQQVLMGNYYSQLCAAEMCTIDSAYMNTSYEYIRVNCNKATGQTEDMAIALVYLQFFGFDGSEVGKIHSAAYDTVYYYDANSVERQLCVTDENGIGTVDWSELEPGIYTFYSSVAKNPDNLTEEYSRTVKITRTTTEIYLMPENALYWYGYEDENLEDMSSAQGWYWDGAAFEAPQHLSNKLYLVTTGSSAESGVGPKQLINGQFVKCTWEGLTARGGSTMDMYAIPAKAYVSGHNRYGFAGFEPETGVMDCGSDRSFAAVAYGASTNGRQSGYIHSLTLPHRSITLYSAANDTIYYLGENDVHIPIAKTDRLGMASVDLGLLPQGSYTLYSSIAYDTDDIANATPFTKTVTIDPSFKGPIIMMPNDGEGVLYWYGVNVANLAYENVARANQYYTVVSYEMRANSIYVDATRGMTQSYAVTSNPVSKGTHTKLRFHTSANAIVMAYASGKAYNSPGPSINIDSSTALRLSEIDLSGYDNYYIEVGQNNGNASGTIQPYYYGDIYSIFFDD